MTGNYERIGGVRYSVWSENGDEPEHKEGDARVEELYFEHTGNLVVRLETEQGLVSMSIPIKAKDSWNEFVDSLPKWSE
jgi:hypothetical protein